MNIMAQSVNSRGIVDKKLPTVIPISGTTAYEFCTMMINKNRLMKNDAVMKIFLNKPNLKADLSILRQFITLNNWNMINAEKATVRACANLSSA